MAAICNGMAAYGQSIPFCATFLNFIQYMLPAVRLSALCQFRVIYIMTHDSIGLGEDGPTHQPVESIPMMRLFPNLHLFRPCDGNEVSGCYKIAIESKKTPSVICLTRQNIDHVNGSSASSVALGAYTVFQSNKDSAPDLVFVGTGSEVHLCVNAAKASKLNVRVVSMPCTTLFDGQSLKYKLSVFPEGVPVLSVEVTSTQGWEKYSHYQIGMKTFGLSAPYQQIYKEFGFTPENIRAKGEQLVKFHNGKAPNLQNRME